MLLPDGEDFLMRPVLAGMTPLGSLDEPGLSLELFALANDALDAKAENEARARAAMERTK